ncbi:MAG: GNAT family N-acetyltransferase [Myxococcota bacterium]
MVVSWLRSADEVYAWAGLRSYPPRPDLFVQWHRDPEVHPFLLVRAGSEEPMAYGEIWEDRDENEAELARLVVDPACRGQGVGQRLVLGLVGEAQGLGFQDIWLRVLSSHHVAQACYRASGFVRATPIQEAQFNQMQPTVYAWIRVVNLQR